MKDVDKDYKLAEGQHFVMSNLEARQYFQRRAEGQLGRPYMVEIKAGYKVLKCHPSCC